MKVLKFGGTSVGTLEALTSTRDIIMAQDGPCVVVVSALGGMTDSLVELCGVDAAGVEVRIESYRNRFSPLISALVPESVKGQVTVAIDRLLDDLRRAVGSDMLSGERRNDLIVSFGERMSSVLASAMFADAARCDAFGMIYTDSSRRTLDRKRSLEAVRERIHPMKERVIIVPGFIALDPNGEVCNLGRGGSDYTAAIIACALEADCLEIWTDVDGYMTADPRVDPSATLIPRLSYDEAFEMSTHGAKVVYAPTIEIIRDYRIPIAVRNTFNPEAPFSLITAGV